MDREQIAAGVRTVVDVARFFDELKQQAAELAVRTGPQTRGYFTPSEEDETVGLLVSYWQARSALFDLIGSFRLDTHLSDEDRPAAFLTAFAAALILIDAARFLRETVHHHPLVRDKLNQPFTQFGIPEGVYDQVQASLLSTRNVWHLYYAIQYFQQYETRLREMAQGTDLEPLVQIIDVRKGRLEVSAARYAQARLRTRVSRLTRRLTHDLLWRAMYGIQKLGGTLISDRYVRRGHRPGLPADVAARLHAQLQPGDVLVVRKEYALTNYFLPGYWPHAALYLGDLRTLPMLGIQDHCDVRPRWARLLDGSLGTNSHRVLESLKDGVQIRPLDSPFASDSIVILRPRLAPSLIAAGLARGLAHEGKSYDFDFDFRRSDRLVCTEVVYRAFDGLGDLQLPLVMRAGRPTLAGRDLIAMAIRCEHFDPIAVFAPLLAAEIATGQPALELLRVGERLTTLVQEP